MNLKKFLPTPEKLGQETLATLFAIIVSALIVQAFPELKKLVKDSNT